jgi:hypothetical protein
MGQVADRRVNLVVLHGFHVGDLGAAGLPQCLDGFDVLRPVFREGRQDAGLALEQAARAASAPLVSAPAMGWPGTKLGEFSAQARPGDGDHILLGAAGVGEDAAGRHGRGDIPEQGGHGADRDGDHDQIGIGHRFAGVLGDGIDDAQFPGLLQVGPAAPDAGYPPHQPLLLQVQGEGTADQADANDDQVIDHFAPRISPRAARQRAFCSGRPMLTRRYSGMA